MFLKSRLLLIGVVCVFSYQIRPAEAQLNDAAIIEAMNSLNYQWQKVLSGKILAVSCGGNSYRGVRAGPNTVVSGVDLKRTNSLMNPYLGVVMISGHFEIGKCSPSVEAMLKTNDWSFNHDMEYNMEAYYSVKGGELVLVGGNNVFANQFSAQTDAANLDFSDEWAKVFHFPIPSR